MQNRIEILTSLSTQHIYTSNMNRLETQAIKFNLLKLKPLASRGFETYAIKQRNCEIEFSVHYTYLLKVTMNYITLSTSKCQPGNKCHGTPKSRQIRREK